MEENSLGDTETVWKNLSCRTLHLTVYPLPERETNATAVAAPRYSDEATNTNSAISLLSKGDGNDG